MQSGVLLERGQQIRITITQGGGRNVAEHEPAGGSARTTEPSWLTQGKATTTRAIA